MKPTKELEALLRAGECMSNMCFNLGHLGIPPLFDSWERYRRGLAQSQAEWDAARNAYRESQVVPAARSRRTAKGKK